VRVEQRLQRMPRRTGLVAAIEDVFARKPRLLGQASTRSPASSGCIRARCRGGCATPAATSPTPGPRALPAGDAVPGARDQDIEGISGAPGFSDRRSFTRAFTRWSGVSPSSFRARRPLPDRHCRELFQPSLPVIAPASTGT